MLLYSALESSYFQATMVVYECMSVSLAGYFLPKSSNMKALLTVCQTRQNFVSRLRYDVEVSEVCIFDGYI